MATTHFISIGDEGPKGPRSSLDRAVAEMVKITTLNGRWRVQMPVETRYGGLVDVSVWPEGGSNTFLVSDDGMAYGEALAANASLRTFNAVAKRRCERVGATFDGATMLFMRVDSAKLSAAITTLANLIKDVIDETLEKTFAEKARAMVDVFHEKVETAFPKADRSFDATVVGRSSTPYIFDALVTIDGRKLAFDLFTKDGNSVNSAYVALSDIARLEDGPKPVGVTRSLQAVGPKLNLINSVATVIELGASRAAYQGLAA